jgi:predicted lipoprotein with Yx(FWY)xxD motif
MNRQQQGKDSPMLNRIGLAAATVALAALVLTGCSAPAAETPEPEPTSASPEPTPTEEAAPPTLLVGETSLGPIVVDAAGLTVYYYDADTAGSGVSTCSGGCLEAWPPVHGTADVTVDGITAEVGSITGTDGQPQLTLNGLPLYYFRDDLAPGDVTGQGLGGVWWVVAPDGAKITG